MLFNETILYNLNYSNPDATMDEIIEVCGTSGSGKTYFCLKMACLAIIENKHSIS